MIRNRSDLLAAAVLFVLLAGILCFAGCGGGEDQVEAEAEAPATDDATTEETAAPDEGGE